MKLLAEHQCEDYLEGLGWSQGLLACGGIEGRIHCFDGQGSGLWSQIAHASGLRHLAWHPKGEQLASLGEDGQVCLWSRGQLLHSRQLQGSWPSKLAWYAKAPFSLAVLTGRDVVLLDSALHPLASSPAYESTLVDLAWLPHRPQLVTCGYRGLQAWDEQLRPGPQYRWQGSTLVLAISPNQKYIATGDQDATVHFWRVNRPDPEDSAMMSGFATKVTCLAWDTSSRFLACGGSSDVAVWDCVGEGPVGRAPRILKGNPEAFIRSLAYRPKSFVLAAGDELGGLRVWDRQVYQEQLEGEVVGLAWSEDGSRLAAASSTGHLKVFEWLK